MDAHGFVGHKLMSQACELMAHKLIKSATVSCNNLQGSCYQSNGFSTQLQKHKWNPQNKQQNNIHLHAS